VEGPSVELGWIV